MKKKTSAINGKTFFTITLAFVVCCLMATGATGPTNTSATVFFIKQDSRFTGLADDFEIVQN